MTVRSTFLFNPVETVDAEDNGGTTSSIAGVGDVTAIVYDGYDRRVKVTDALGTVAFDTAEVRVAGSTDDEDNTVDIGDDPDQGQQNPETPGDGGFDEDQSDDEPADDSDEDESEDEEQPTGTPLQPQEPTGNPAPALCGSGTGAAMMAVNLLAFAVMRRRRRSSAIMPERTKRPAQM